MSLVIEAERVPLEMDAGGLVRIAKTRVTLDSVIAAFHDGASAEQIVEQYPSLDLAVVYAVIGYYLRHQDEVHAYLEEGARQESAIRQQIELRWPPAGIRNRLLARRKGEE